VLTLEQRIRLFQRDLFELRCGWLDNTLAVGDLLHGEVEPLPIANPQRELDGQDAGLAAQAPGNGHVAVAVSGNLDGTSIDRADFVARVEAIRQIDHILSVPARDMEVKISAAGNRPGPRQQQLVRREVG
jgi:hypothetical protein